MKIRKNLFMLMVALVATTAFAACGGDDDNDGGGGSSVTVSGLKVSPETLSFTNAGGTQTISVQSNAAPTAVSSAADWLSVSVGQQSQNLKVTPVTVTATANTGNDDRTATIAITAGKETQTVSVTQLSTDGLQISQTAFEVPADGGQVSLTVSANGAVTQTISAGWVTQNVTKASMQSETRTYTVGANPGPARSATITFTLGALSATATISQEGTSATGGITATAREVARQMYPGWNLGNTLEPPVNGLNAEISWQPTMTTQQIIDYVKSLGFRSVRIPCSWDCHTTNGVIDAAWMARVREVVDYCIADGLYVLLNDHWDNGWIETNGFNNLSETNVSAKLTALKNLWTQIANEFRDYDEHLLFGGLNEPNCDNQAKTDALLRYEQGFIDAVRATGGNNLGRVLVVQGPSTDIDNTNNYYDVTRLSDSASGRLMVEVHYYTPWNFCGMEQDESWGKMFWYWGSGNHVTGSSHNANWGEESDLRTQLQKMKTKFVDNGVPVYIGEYGCQWRDLSSQSGEDQAKHDASVKAFHKTVNQYAITYGMIPVVWDINYTNRGGTKGVMTVINRKDCSIFSQPAMDGITEGVAAATWPY